MKRKLFLVFVIGMMLFTACQAATTAPPQAAPEATKPPTAAPQSAAPVEITYMMWGAPEELQVWQAIVDDFQAANPNIKVKVDVSDWDSYWTKLNTLFAGGTPPDVFAMDAPLYLDWQSRGVLLDLTPYIKATSGFFDGLYDQPVQSYKVGDSYFGLPRDCQTIVLFYNKDMFDKAGVAYPTDKWTMTDLREAAKKLTVDTNNDGKIEQYGLYLDPWDMEIFWSEAIWGYGGDIISADHTKTLIGDEKARQAWQLIYDMMRTDKSVPDPNTAGQYGSDLFQAGVAAMTTIGHWAVPGYATTTFKWDVAPMPSGPAGRATSINSAGFVVAKASKQPETAWEFIKFALSQKEQTRLAELGFAIPIYKAVANSPAFLDQKTVKINEQVFLDAFSYAHVKPIFKGYDAWAAAVGDGLTPVWNGEAELNPTLDEVVTAADKVLAENQ